MFKSLKIKLLFFFFIAISFILFAFSTFIYNMAEKAEANKLDATLKIISLDAFPDLKGKGYVDAKDVSEELMHEFEISSLEVKIIYYDKSTKSVMYETVSSVKKSYLFEIPLNVLGKLHVPYYDDNGLYRISSMLLLEDEHTKVFFQLATTKLIDSPYLEQIISSLFIANPIIIILFLLIANILINKTLLPVKEVVASVQKISAERLSDRLNTTNVPSEVKNLVKTFNQLLARLEDSFEKISAFSSDASHELKTPLTVIRGDIEVALRKDRTPQKYKEVLEEVLQETLHVQDTIDQLFLLTKRDSQEFINNKTEVYLDEIILDAIKQVNPLAEKSLITINIKNILPASIYANEILLEVAINNILRNAILYSTSLSKVEVSMHEDSEFYYLKIEDFGCGISQEDIPLIFSRFYRVDKARSRQNGGTGLGLAIVKMILDIHDYQIDVSSVVHEGTSFIIKIPK